MDDAETKPPRSRLSAAQGPSSLFLSFVALALAGCASTPPAPDASESHPANPQAAQSGYPPPQPGLLSITNMVEVKPVPELAPERQQEHEGHDTEPKAEEKK